MFSFITLALAATASVSALTVPIPRGDNAAKGYGVWLEDYNTYHDRYVAIGCTGKQGSDFFEQCCHPLLKGQALTSRPAQCAASASSTVSSVAATPTSDSEDECEEGDENCVCDDEDDETASSSTPAPVSTPVATPTQPASTSAPVQTSSPGGQVFDNGHATFFYQGGNAGACGIVHSDSDYVAALPGAMYGDYSKQSDNCGKKIRVTRKSTGKSVDVIVADACPSCGGNNDVDLSKDAFLQIATEAEGMVDIFYSFI